MKKKTGKAKKVYIMVGIAGGSCAGKSTFAKRLQSRLGVKSTALLNQDAYYRDQSHLTVRERANINFDHPNAIEMPLFIRHIKQLIKGKPVQKPTYSYRKHARMDETKIIRPSKVLLVEGLFLYGPYPAEPLFKLRIYLDVPEDNRRDRRFSRDIKERSDTLDDMIMRWQRYTGPMHALYVEPQKKTADFVLSGTRDDIVLAAQQIKAML